MAKYVPFVVFDCNVLVQALLNPLGASGKCFDLARNEQVLIFVSAETIAEVRDVLLRPKAIERLSGSTPDQIESFISEIYHISQGTTRVATGQFKFDRDPKDEMILDLAITANASYIISRDNDLLDLMTGFDDASKEFRQRYRNIKVVRPDEFLKIISETGLTLAP